MSVPALLLAPLRRRPGRGAGLILLALLFFPLAWGCAKNPVTGQRQFVLFTERQEIAMGEEADRDITASLGIYEDEAMAALLDDMGQRMAANSERPDLPWTFRIMDDPTVNAFALPGGYVYFTRGILAHLSSEAQLAGILGHEIGHITARHGVVRVSRAQLTQLGLGAAMILSPDLRPFGDAIGAGVGLLFLQNSRSDERQADELGMRYMQTLDYDPRELGQVFEILARASGARDGDRIPGFLSTHPDPLDRRDEILQRVEEEGRDLSDARVGRDSYLRLLDGMLFGQNPREGFFRNGDFLHPDMEFRFEFPSGWRTANARTQVQGISPDQDAVVVITLEERESPADARRAFLAQSGVETVSRSDARVGGLPAASAEFRVRTDDGTFGGMVVFVRHEGLTFRLLGYAPVSVWPERRSAVSASLFSFRELTDPEVLAVEPWRIEIVRAPREMSFEEFLQEFPSTRSDDMLGTINQLDPGDRIPEGTLLKRVVGGPEL